MESLHGDFKVKMSSRELTKIYFVLAILLLSVTTGFSQKLEPSREYQIKAVFLFNLTQFTEWPKSSFSGNNVPIVIGILGTDPFGGSLNETVEGEKINERPLLIEHYSTVDDMKPCHILFITLTKPESLEKIFISLKGKTTLTVGDAKDFVKSGGMMGFITDNNKIRIQINMEALKSSDLTISSKLLRLAEIIVP